MQPSRILVVEDDPVIAQNISRGLSALGYSPSCAANGADALDACAAAPFDAVVLDRMLPDISGTQVLERLSAAGGRPPVLMLSALGSVEDRVEGLVAGADDYLTKPFDMAELSARLVAICRRGADRGPAREDAGGIAVGRLHLDVAGHRALWADEQVVTLNRKQFSLLAFLMRHADRSVTRSMLLENVWGYAFDPATNIV
ncbi:MAG TPA: response regulator transcription factor, partial [Novosphingobium sp.]|nr:response regulator transcription factor [Novosphingobium sp.]